MAKSSKRAKAAKKRRLIGELISGVQAMRGHRGAPEAAVSSRGAD